QGTQHLRRDRVVALVLGVTEGHVRLVGVQAGVLQRVRRELCVQADPPPFLAQVEQESTDRAEALDRLGELRSTVAALAAEDIAREAFAVRPHQRWRAAILTAANRGLPVAEPK